MTSKLTITREQATDKEIQMLIDSHENGTAMFLRVDAYYLMAKELQERRRAALDSEPVAYMWDSKRNDIDAPGFYFPEHLFFAESNVKQWGGEVIPLYRHAQQPVVQDERAAFNAWNNDIDCPLAGRDAKSAAWLAWQARAELAGNSPVIPDRWIPVSERMPKTYVNVLLTDEYNDICIGQLEFEGDIYFYVVGSTHRYKATHWMPLPAAPQEVK